MPTRSSSSASTTCRRRSTARRAPRERRDVLLEANGQIGAEVVAQAALVAPVIFAYLGQNLLGIAIQAEPARRPRDRHVRRRRDRDVPAGSLSPSRTRTATSTPSRSTSTSSRPRAAATSTSTLTALEPGAAANGSYGPAELIDVLDGVDARP
jgi:hypothetical protein